MRLRLERAPYEKLIQQMVYIDENISDIALKAADTRLFVTRKRAELFFKEYVSELESLLRGAKIVDSPEENGVNSLPFIVLGSSFTLIDRQRHIKQCHMAYDVLSDRKCDVSEIYFLSGAGRSLLWKEVGDSVKTDIGAGLTDYRVHTIKID